MTLISMLSLVSYEPMEFQKTQPISNSKRHENYNPFRERERGYYKIFINLIKKM